MASSGCGLRALSRLTADLLRRLCAADVRRLPSAADRADDDLDCEPEDDEISDDLPGDHEPRRLALGRDVAEPDRREHRDGEVQPIVCVSRSPKLLADIPAMTT